MRRWGRGGCGSRGWVLQWTYHSKPQMSSRFLRSHDIRGVYDLVIAQAFLDLVDLDSVLPLIGASLRPGGLIYLCINFDGGTIFDPVVDAELDARIEALYHRTMDERVADGKASGDSRTGRRLFSGLRRIGAQVLDAGPSDWVVYPGC